MTDRVLNVRQISQYEPRKIVAGSDAILLQIGGLGGRYAHATAADLISSALSQGFMGDTMTVNGRIMTAELVAQRGGIQTLDAGQITAQLISATGIDAAGLTIGGKAAATQTYADDLFANSVVSFEGRTGDVTLTRWDIIGAGGAPIHSPRFTGSPVAPTPSAWSHSNRVATTGFVHRRIVEYVEHTLRTQPFVWSINGKSGEVTISAADLPGIANEDWVKATFAPLNSPQFSGIPTAPTPSLATATGQIATTAFVQSLVTASTAGVATFNTRAGAVVLLLSDLTDLGAALLDSPYFVNNARAPTPPSGNQSNRIATTQFVADAVAGITVSGGVTSFNTRTGPVVFLATDLTQVGGLTAATAVTHFMGRQGNVSLIAADLSAVNGALLASPNFTGIPTVPQPVAGYPANQITTTQWVNTAITNAISTDVVTGFGSPARQGNVQLQVGDLTPPALGLAFLASPQFTGVPQAPTATPATTNTQQIATTAFVQNVVAAKSIGVAGFGTPPRTGNVVLEADDLTALGLAPNQSFVSIGTPGVQASGGTQIGNVINGPLWLRGHPGGSIVVWSNDGNTNADLQLRQPGAPWNARSSVILGSYGGSQRWQIALGDGEANGNHFRIDSLDGVTHVGMPLHIHRMTMAATWAGQVNFSPALGWGCGRNPTQTFQNTNSMSYDPGPWGCVIEGTVEVLTLNKSVGAGTIVEFHSSGALQGNISVDGAGTTTLNSSSDARLKEDERSFDAGSILDQLKVWDFRWKKTGRRGHGVVGQEAVEVYPEAVTHDQKHDWWGVDYSKFVPLLLSEIKALRTRVARLEAAA